MNETKQILDAARTIAIVGLSDRPSRPSHQVAQFLQRVGYRIVPVNPRCEGTEVLGEMCYSSLAEIPADIEIDMVDVFRRSEFAGDVVDAAIVRGAAAVWMQLGVIDEAAAERAETAGLMVAMDRCPAIEHRRFYD